MLRIRRVILTVLVTFGVLSGAGLAWSASALAAPLQAPEIVSEAVAEATPVGAVLEARVNPEGEASTYLFEYSTSPTLATGVTVVGAGSLPGVVEELQAGPAGIGGLSANTTYYYRVVATDGSGTTTGTIEHFTTSILEKPVVSDEPAAGVGQTVASLSGQVNPEFQPLSVCEFEFVSETVFNATGFTVAPGLTSCAPAAGELGEGGSSEAVGAGLSGLEANTTYDYRLLATNATGTGEGATQSFLTLPNPPTVTTGGASEVGPNTATISGSVNPGSVGVNSDTTYYFQYSTDTSYSNQIPLVPGDAGQGTSFVSEQAALGGLESDTTYHYRIVASNDNANTAGGTPQVVYGQGATFTTPATPPILGGVAVSGVSDSAASIEVGLDAQSLLTHWELRLSNTQGSLDPLAGGNIDGSASEAIVVGAGSLSPGTVYYYKLTAINANGTVETPEGSFTTAPAPASTNVNLFTTPPLLSIPANVFPAEETGTTGKSTTKALSRAQKLKDALKACAKDKRKGRRAACEKTARRAYGTTANGRKK